MSKLYLNENQTAVLGSNGGLYSKVFLLEEGANPEEAVEKARKAIRLRGPGEAFQIALMILGSFLSMFLGAAISDLLRFDKNWFFLTAIGLLALWGIAAYILSCRFEKKKETAESYFAAVFETPSHNLEDYGLIDRGQVNMLIRAAQESDEVFTRVKAAIFADLGFPQSQEKVLAEEAKADHAKETAAKILSTSSRKSEPTYSFPSSRGVSLSDFLDRSD